MLLPSVPRLCLVFPTLRTTHPWRWVTRPQTEHTRYVQIEQFPSTTECSEEPGTTSSVHTSSSRLVPPSSLPSVVKRNGYGPRSGWESSDESSRCNWYLDRLGGGLSLAIVERSFVSSFVQTVANPDVLLQRKSLPTCSVRGEVRQGGSSLPHCACARSERTGEMQPSRGDVSCRKLLQACSGARDGEREQAER